MLTLVSYLHLQDIHLGIEELQTSVGEVLEAAKLLIGEIEPQGTALIQSETRLLSRNVLHLGQALVIRREQLQVSTCDVLHTYKVAI